MALEIKGKKITVAGGGGAATAIQVQCALDGAREISIFNIKDAFFERTLQTAEKIKKAVPECVVNVYDIADTAKMTEEIQSSDIFANATIVGMKPMDDQSVVKDLSHSVRDLSLQMQYTIRKRQNSFARQKKQDVPVSEERECVMAGSCRIQTLHRTGYAG